MKYLFYALFALLIIEMGCRPMYNWDMIPYMAATLDLELGDFQEVHTRTYQTLKSEMTDWHYAYLTSGPGYRKEMLDNAEAFHEQMPYYSIRLGYIWMIYLLYKVGVPLSYATVMPSLIAVFLLICLLYNFIQSKSSDPLIAGFICLFLLKLDPLCQIARFSTPDACSAFALVLITVSYLDHRSVKKLIPLFFLAVLIRTDNVIFCVVLLMVDWISLGKSKEAIFWWGGIIVGLGGLYVGLNQIFSNGGWGVVFYNSLVQRLSFPLSQTPEMTFQIYLTALKNGIREFYPFIPVLFLMVYHGIKAKFLGGAQINRGKLILFSVGIVFIVRFLLFPSMLWRLYFVYAILALLAVVAEWYSMARYSYQTT